MASEGDQIDSKYIIYEAEDIIKKIKSLETDDRKSEESDRYSLSRPKKSSHLLVHPIMTYMNSFSLIVIET